MVKACLICKGKLRDLTERERSMYAVFFLPDWICSSCGATFKNYNFVNNDDEVA